MNSQHLSICSELVYVLVYFLDSIQFVILLLLNQQNPFKPGELRVAGFWVNQCFIGSGGGRNVCFWREEGF